MVLMPFRKRAAQALGLLIMLAGCPPLLWGLSVWTGMLSYNFGHRDPPLTFTAMVLGAIPVGVLAIWLGKRLLSWGMRSTTTPPVERL